MKLSDVEIAGTVAAMCEAAAFVLKLKPQEVAVECLISGRNRQLQCHMTLSYGAGTLYIQTELSSGRGGTLSTSEVATAVLKQASTALGADPRVKGKVVFVEHGALVVRRA